MCNNFNKLKRAFQIWMHFKMYTKLFQKPYESATPVKFAKKNEDIYFPPPFVEKNVIYISLTLFVYGFFKHYVFAVVFICYSQDKIICLSDNSKCIV